MFFHRFCFGINRIKRSIYSRMDRALSMDGQTMKVKKGKDYPVSVSITLRLTSAALSGRACMRCKGIEFREVMFSPYEQQAISPDGKRLFKEDKSPYIIKSEYGGPDGDSSRHLAVCVSCGFLVDYV